MAANPTRARRTETAAKLAKRFGVHPVTIRRTVAEERAEYELRAQTRREQIVDLHRQGWTGRAIAAHLEVTPGLISKRLREAREANIDLSPYPPKDANS